MSSCATSKQINGERMLSSVELVTREIALEMLSRNEGNRPLRPSVVKALSAAIKRGEWVVSHQGVAIDTSGRLLDGQHRLRAIADSGIACRIMVTRNVPRESFRVMDQGAKRTMTDISGIDSRVADTCNLAARLTLGPRPTFAQVEPIINSRIGSTIIDLIDYCGTARRFYSSAPVRLACSIVALRGEKEREYAFHTYRALINLDFDGMSRSAKSLVKQEQKGKNLASSAQRGDAIARAFAAFDVNKQEISRIQISGDAVNDALRLIREVVRAEVATIAAREVAA